MSFPDSHELAGIAKRKRLNEHCVDDAEERGIASRTERNGENRYQRKDRPAAEGANGGSHFNILATLRMRHLACDWGSWG